MKTLASPKHGEASARGSNGVLTNRDSSSLFNYSQDSVPLESQRA